MILAINTASEKNSIALFWPNKLSKQVSWSSYHTQSQELLPKIDRLLKKNRIKLSDLDAIAVYQGPGSYTGLRVGISVANAMAWGLDIPVVGIKMQTAKRKDQNDNLKCKNYEYNALEIAKRAYDILKGKKLRHFDKTQCRKFSKIVIPYYGSPLK